MDENVIGSLEPKTTQRGRNIVRPCSTAVRPTISLILVARRPRAAPHTSPVGLLDRRLAFCLHVLTIWKMKAWITRRLLICLFGGAMTFGYPQTVKKVPYTNWRCQQFRRRTGGWMLYSLSLANEC